MSVSHMKIEKGIETGIKGNADCLLLLNKGNPHLLLNEDKCMFMD